MARIELSIHGMEARCDTDYGAIANRIEDHLSRFLSDGVESRIVSSCKKSPKLSDARELATHLGGGEQVARSTYVGGRWVVTGDRFNNAYCIERKEYGLKVGIYYDSRRSRLDPIRAIRNYLIGSDQSGSDDRRSELYVRRLIHFPLFHLFEKERGWAVVHGAVVAAGDDGALLTGFDGVGKSTLALALCQKARLSLLSDNFCLTDGRRFHAFPEMARLSVDAATAAGVVERMEEMPRQDDRYYINTESLSRVGSAMCKLVIMNRLNDDGLLTTEVGGRCIERQLQAMWSYLPEFKEYGIYRSLAVFVGGRPWPPGECGDSVGKLSDAKTLVMSKGDIDDIAGAVDMLEQWL